ncbi:MAG: hypothetical protein RIF41_28650 [Polyangiaceae bacterium]
MSPRSLVPLTILAAALCAQPAMAQPADAQPEEGPSGDDVIKRACKVAYEAAQERRLEKKLLQAREELRACVEDACPTFVRKDCATWLDEVDRAIPTVVLRFVDATGTERGDVRVTVDGELLVERLDGGAVPIDPGPHVFVFEPAGGDPVEQTLTILEGERLREVAVDQSPPSVVPPPPPPMPPPPPKSVHPMAWVLYGTSAAALGAFIGLGVHSLSLEDCEPRCSDDQVDDVVLFRAVADVSLGVSALALGGAIWITVASLSEDDDAASARWDLEVSPTGAAATVRF